MGLCLEAAGKLTVVEQKARKSNILPSTAKFIEPLRSDAFASPSSPLHCVFVSLWAMMRSAWNGLDVFVPCGLGGARGGL